MGGHGGKQVHTVLRALGGEVAAQTPPRILARAGRQRRQTAHRPARQRRVPRLFIQIEQLGGRSAIDRTALALGRLAPRLIGVLRQIPALGAGFFGQMVDKHRRIIGEKVEQGVQPFIEQRKPVLDALTTRALADGGIHGLVARRAEQIQIVGAETGNRRLIDQDFRHRRQADRAQLAAGTLGFGIKGADRFQLAAEHVQTHRLVKARRKDVDHPAAYSVFPAFMHRGGAAIAIGRHIGFQRVGIEVLTDLGFKARDRHRLERRHPLGAGRDGGHHQQWRLVRRIAQGQSRQRRHALRRNRRRGA